MTQFKGFPSKMQFTPIPNIVFSSLLPQMTNITELKTLLYIFGIIYPKKGSVRFATDNELLNQANRVAEFKDSPQETLRNALEELVKKGIILTLTLKNGDKPQNLYFLNNEANKLAVSRILSGEIVLPGLRSEGSIPVTLAEPSDIFTLYEQNIGMLTPLIADELKEAGKQYPETWIKDAIKEAVEQNKRNWRYIDRILEHWSTEGKDDGTHRGNPKTNTDPDKYVRGKYGHMVQR
jgi:DNA replication protein